MELDDSNSQQESLYKTRSGRVVKPVKPLYVPDLNAVEDDFGSDEIDEELAFADDDGDSIHTSSEEDEVEDERGNIIKIGRVPSELVNSSAKQSSMKRKRDDSDDDDDDESEYQPGDSSELEEELHDSDYEQDVVSEVESDVECEDDVGSDESSSQDESQEESCSDDSEMDECSAVNDDDSVTDC